MNPFAAIQNNAVGTFTLAQAALDAGVRQLVMVSTDKAVDPASVMGASKRMAELILLSMPGPMRSKSVRLGNVLGSHGSVVPHFLSQIERGEAVTVTDPGATRYFLSLDRAVSLLIHALEVEHAGILVPELGEPLRITALAEKLIDAVGGGAAPRSKIVYMGLRPGDKLSEQLLSPRESYIAPAGGPLRAVRSPGWSFAAIKKAIATLEKICREHDLPAMLDELSRLVPEYSPSMMLQHAAVAGCLP
jgi:FlaA1/EpsC-like NDP-sugar epimerase